MSDQREREIVALVFSRMRKRRGSPAILLDRDGVINRRIHDGYVTKWSEFKFIPGISRAIAGLSASQLPIIVVSNQAGAGKGLLTRATLIGITKRFVAALRRRGARIDAVYYCPHTALENCGCRKPQPGLLKRAAADWGLDLTRSVLVGDTLSDLAAAAAVGGRGLLLGSGRAMKPGEGRAAPAPRNLKAVVTPSEIVQAVRNSLAGKD